MLDTKVYKQKNISFIITADRIVVRTPLNQAFYLQPRQHYWTRRLKLIRMMVELDEIRDLNELASWSGRGIEWVSTSRKYELENDKVLA